MMKKVYNKPDIVFEDFSLNVSIATTCEREVGTFGRSACPIMGSEGIAFFSAGIAGSLCEFDPVDFDFTADEYDGFCYDVPNENRNWFNS